MTEVSLIITTYNNSSYLIPCVLSALNQQYPPSEIIIADDGSSAEERAQFLNYFKNSKIPITHIWHEDLGFRAALIRNRAISHAKYPYLVLIDGDMLLHPFFIFDHAQNARKNQFIQGSRVLLGPSISQKIQKKKDIILPRIGSKDIYQNSKNTLRILWLSRYFAQKSSYSFDKIRTCNFSFYKEDAIKVNGFDNRFIGWGREDSEFAVRLVNAKTKRINLRFAGIAYHLYHVENTRENLPQNDQLLAHSIENKNTWTQYGLAQVLLDESIVTQIC